MYQSNFLVFLYISNIQWNSMRNMKLTYLVAALSMILVTNDPVWARGGGHFGGHHHGHSHLSIGLGYFGPGFYGGYGYGGYGFGGYGYPFYYPPSYSYPQTVIVPTSPPVYIQQPQAQPVQPQTSYWYYCQNPEGYYPYIKDCPVGWLQVAPQPARP
jgi:hypothetical protein